MNKLIVVPLDLFEELLAEAESWLDEARGCAPDEVAGYTGWAERARAILKENGVY